MSLSVNIRKNLGDFRLDVAFESGDEVLALLGASGCGKSVTLKCIAGILTPDEGRIVLNGRVLFDAEEHINLPPQKRNVGYLFQQYALFPNMNVRQNILSGARGRKDAEEAAGRLMEKMHLGDLVQKRPHQLSGGQQQRVALARILISEPELLLLDEPFSALDSYLRWELEMELADILRDFEGPAVFVSHSREEVVRLCRSVCVLKEGKSEEKRSVKALFSRPDTLSACLLSGCKNISRMKALGDGRVLAEDWGVTLTVGSEEFEPYSYLGVKSRHLNIVDRDGENTFRCTVRRLVEDERRYHVVLATPGGDKGYACLNMMLSYREGAALRPGDELLICIEADDIMLLRK